MYPDGSALNTFPNALGEPTQAGNYATNVTYHPNGGVFGFNYGNGIVHSQTQNTRGLPRHRTETYPVPAATFMDLTHTYDQNGNLTKRLDGDGSDGVLENRAMTYDGLDRLLTANATGMGTLGTEAYTYDPLDNLRSVNFAGYQRTPELHTYSYDAQNRLSNRHLTDGVGNVYVSYGYDERGNMTVRGNHTHVYDRANRMRSANTAGGNETYRYDGHGRRTAITRSGGTTIQLYTRDGKLIHERSPGGTVTRHIHLGDRLVATNTLGVTVYQHTDTLGSVARRTNGSRVTVAGGSTFYGPYGSQFGGSPYEQRPAFTGHLSDKLTTLTYMQQRYYDPLAMRFVSIDPVATSTVDASNFNRYWYANNNPYKYTDPDGRRACGKDTGCQLDGGAYGGSSGTVIRASSFTRSEVETRNVADPATRNNAENTLVRDANRVVDMANRSGDQQFIRALNSVKRLIIDGRSATEATHNPFVVAYTTFGSGYIVFILEKYFSLGSHPRAHKFTHEVFHQTEEMENKKLQNPSCGWGCRGGHEHATEAATYNFMSQWWDPAGIN